MSPESESQLPSKARPIEATLSVEHGRARVATGDVIVGREAQLHLARGLIGIGAEVGLPEEPAS